MLAAVEVVLMGLAFLSLISLVLGLVRPVLVLWFLDRFNRLKVIQVYGLLFLVFVILWQTVKYFLIN